MCISYFCVDIEDLVRIALFLNFRVTNMHFCSNKKLGIGKKKTYLTKTIQTGE